MRPSKYMRHRDFNIIFQFTSKRSDLWLRNYLNQGLTVVRKARSLAAMWPWCRIVHIDNGSSGYRLASSLSEHLLLLIIDIIKGVEIEEGMQLTISPTCEQKPHFDLFIAICYLYFAKLRNLFFCTFPVTFLHPFGFCSWTVACPLLLILLFNKCCWHQRLYYCTLVNYLELLLFSAVEPHKTTQCNVYQYGGWLVP